MKRMPPEENAPIDLLDLKMLPAWMKETPDSSAYAHYEGETEERGRRPRGRDRRPPGRREQRERKPNRGDRGDRRRSRPDQDRHRKDRHRDDRRPQHGERAPEKPLPDIAVRFIPQTNAFDNVAAQIKGDTLAYSLYALARLFLQKPERYDVHLAAKAETPLYQLGENGAISADKIFLENNAFRFAQKDFYKIDISQSEPIKGNFTSVARERTTGTLLGPTNHHAYQPKLRALYEQRFSRRMSFQDFQRQIEIVSDVDLIEKWKEEARTVTTFSTVREETPQTFANASEAEKHFRQTYLPTLVRQIEETITDGLTSRSLPDRQLRRAIENAWTAQTRSPSQMMAELSTRFREAGLHIFRHRKGMLFVSPVRVRGLVYEETSVSPQVRAIVETIAANPQINRKDFAEKVLVDLSGEELEARKLSLASDLKWLISEGYVIEFNDGSLDLPRAKKKADEKPEEVAATVPATAESSEQTAPAPEISTTTEETEVGGA